MFTRPPGSTPSRTAARILASIAVVALALGHLGAVALAIGHPGLLTGTPDPELADDLAALGLPLGAYVALLVAVQVAVLAATLVAAGFLLRARGASAFPALLAVVLTFWVTCGGPAPAIVGELWPTVAAFTALLPGPAWAAFYITLTLIFPTGRFVPGWTRWIALALLVWSIAATVAIPLGLDIPVAVTAVGLLGVCAWAAIRRYRSVSDREGREQTRWVLVALGLHVPYLLWVMVSSIIGLTAMRPGGLTIQILSGIVGYSLTIVLVAAIALAVLRHRLFDIDLVVNRALLYGALTAFVLACYALVVGGIGAVWPPGGPLALPLVATTIAALVLAPLRRVVQRRVDRLVYGERGDPYAVLIRLGERLEAAGRTPAVLSTIVETIADALRYPLVRLTVKSADGDVSVQAPVRGDAPGRPVAIPVGESGSVGVLEVWPRAGERLRRHDREVLHRLAAQAVPALRASALDEHLQRSREQIVGVREEERRRLRRDLHDGIGPTLASLSQRITMADRLLEQQPDASHRLLTQAASQLGATIDDLRRVVDALRPASLDELGLVAAVRAAWPSGADSDGVVVEVEHGDIGELSAAVEVASYRIVMESVTNAVRHAGARRCVVGITVDDDVRLRLTIEDDGSGGAGGTFGAGVGIESMRERVAELGGTFEIRDRHPSGTLVVASLPLDERVPA
jgi:signal transduction histidine kinase